MSVLLIAEIRATVVSVIMIGISRQVLAVYSLMDSSFWFNTINLGWSIVYIEGAQVVFFKQIFNSQTGIVNPLYNPLFSRYNKLGMYHCVY